MAPLDVNGLCIEYDHFGDRGACRTLAGRGHFVVRFDNRDVGPSLTDRAEGR